MNEQLFDVTFFNPLADRRGTLIDKVDEETADAVVAKFSNRQDNFFYLPEVRKEPAGS